MGTYFRLVDMKNQQEKEQDFLEEKDKLSASHKYVCESSSFYDIPEYPYIYWFGKDMKAAYINGECLNLIAEPKAGLATGNNEIFQRCWFEVSFEKIDLSATCVEDTFNSKKKWYPCNSGGFYRKWYPYNLYVINWEKDGKEIKEYRNAKGKLAARPQNTRFYFKEGLTWNKISTSRFAVEYKEAGFIFDDTSRSAFVENNSNLWYLIGVLCSKGTLEYLRGLNPTMSFTNGDISRIPFVLNDEYVDEVSALVEDNVLISKGEFDDFERSWGYQQNSLVEGNTMGKLISDKYEEWYRKCDARFDKMKKNEERLNDIFITIYGLSNEITADVLDEEITIVRANLQREIKSLISYAIGCIMGRYSLREKGLTYAGGKWDASKYLEDFKPCEYGIIPITENQYFSEDLCTRVIDFIKVVYGEDTLNENLKFIAKALKPDSYEAPKKILRDYLFNGFFDNHYQIYQHRPIYWQLDSGKAGGFRAIMYMHRFNENTLSTVRTEYIQELQYKYEDELQRLQHRLGDAKTTAEKNEVKKQATAIDKKLVECTVYDDLLNHVTGSIQNYVFDLDDGVKTNYAKFLSIDGDKTKNVLTVIKL